MKWAIRHFAGRFAALLRATALASLIFAVASTAAVSAAPLDGHRLFWQWDDRTRMIVGMGPQQRRLFLSVRTPTPNELRLTNAYFSGNFPVGDLLLKPRINLGGTRVRWKLSGSNATAGLYENNLQPIVSLQGTFDENRWSRIRNRVEDELIPTGGSQEEWLDVLDDAQDVVRLTQVTVNPRLLDRRIDIGYRPADEVLHMLARDFSVVNVDLSGSHLLESRIGQQMVGMPVNRILENQEKLLVAHLSQELHGPMPSPYRQALWASSLQDDRAGAVQFLNPNGFLTGTPLYEEDGGFRLGYRRGWMETSLPLFDGASHTHLRLSSDVEVAHTGWRQPILSDQPVSVAIEGLAYVANFRDDLEIALAGPRDSLREEFLTYRQPAGVLLGEVEEERVSELTLPGGFLGVEFSGLSDRWGVTYRAVPYLPIEANTAPEESEATALNNLVEVGDALGLASDLSGFFRQPLGKTALSVGFHKDAADRFEVVPAVQLLPGLKAGIGMKQARTFGDVRSFFGDAEWKSNTLAVRFEKDEAHQIRSREFRVGHRWPIGHAEVGMAVKQYLTGTEYDESDPLLEREWMLRVSDPSRRNRLILSHGVDTLAGQSNLFTGMERSISDSFRCKGGVEFISQEEGDSEIRGSVNLRWMF